MTTILTTSAFNTLPVVAFHRLHVDTKEPVEFHALIFRSAEDARAKAEWIESQDHLALIAMTDAMVENSHPASNEPSNPPPTQTEYGKRLDAIRARIAERLGEKPAVFFSTYKKDADDLPLDNLDEIAIQGRVQFHADRDPFWGNDRPYTSPIVESPTWLDVAVLANEMIKTTGDYHHQFLEGVYVTGEEDGVRLARFSMGS